MKYSTPLFVLFYICTVLSAETFGATRFALNGRTPPQNFQVPIDRQSSDVPFPLVTQLSVPSTAQFDIPEEEEEEEEDEVPPSLTSIPRSLRFSCRNRIQGFYADPQAGCQVYHRCLYDGRRYSFLCGKGTIFNQKNFVCDHWYNYNCNDAEIDAHENARMSFIL
uniref:Chitin-binding type-2 domain-containing protein n=1 Tax=Strigamia maritima TaxID=126957 RepID=T1JG12_STRMM